MAEFSDSDGNTDPSVYGAQTNFGDGSPPTNLDPISFANGVFTVSSYHLLEEGSYTVLTTVTDNADHGSTTISSPAVVTDAALSATQTNYTLQLHAGVAFSGLLASFQDASATGSQADYQRFD